MLHKMKGRTVLDEEDRYNAVRHCRYVDEVLRNAPWEYTDQFLNTNKIDFVAHDDIPYASEGTDDVYGPLKKKGMFIATQRTEGVSTSDIVARIVRDYDGYARRNLVRGYSAREMNIPYLKEKKLKFKIKMDELKDKGKKFMDTVTECKQEILTKWEDKSAEMVENFLMMFERRRLKDIWNGSKERFIKALTPPGSPTPGTSSDFEGIESDDEAPRPKLRRLF